MTGTMPRTAMVLAAGLGKRLRPITDTLPKPLVPIAGKTLARPRPRRARRRRRREGRRQRSPLSRTDRRHVAARGAPRIVISDESAALLDSAGGIVKALPELGSDPFYILNADTFWIDRAGSNLERLALAWDEARMDILVMLADPASATGHSKGTDFTIGADGRLSRANDAPDGLIYAGAAIVHPRIFAGATAKPHSLNLYFDRAIAAGRLFGMKMDGHWITVGTPDAIPLAEQAIAASSAARIVIAGRFPRVLSIPADAPFLPTLADAVLGGTLVPEFAWDGEPLTLADTTIFVPTRRAARELRDGVRRAARRTPDDPAGDPAARRVRRGRRRLRGGCRRNRAGAADRAAGAAAGAGAAGAGLEEPAAGACRGAVRGRRDRAGFRGRCDLAGARPRRADRRDRNRRRRLERSSASSPPAISPAGGR